MVRVVAVVLMLACCVVLHPVLMLIVALGMSVTSGRKRRTSMPRAALVAPAVRLPTRAEVLAQRFGRVR